MHPYSWWRYPCRIFAVMLVATLFVVPTHAQTEPPTNAAPRYTITDLGTLPGGNQSEAHAINNRGQVVGSATVDANGLPHAFLWQTGVITDLGTLPGERNASTANAINDAGEIAGTSSRLSGGFGIAVRWSSSVITEVGTLGGRLSFGNGIDPTGRVVGGSEVRGSRTTHPFVWENGAFTDLGLLPNQFAAAANDVNAVGQIVGYAGHAFLWQTGVFTDLGTLPGGTTSEARAINSRGHIVGASTIGVGLNTSAVLWHDGGLTNVGTLDQIPYSVANDINDAGQVVGSADPRCTPCQPAQAFVWEDGTIQALDALIPVNSGWALETATGINNAGQIVGAGRINGARHAFLLTPVPLTPTCVADQLGAASTYNLFSLGSYKQVGGATEGGVAAAGPAILLSHQIGTQLTADGTATALAVGGNLFYVGGAVTHGNVLYGENLTISNVLLGEGSIRRATPIDFAATQQSLLQASSMWSTVAANGTITVTEAATITPTLTLVGTDPILNVFAVQGTTLSNANALAIRVPAQSSVLINVTGADVHLRQPQLRLEGVNASRIIYNFVQATALELRGTLFEGTVFAPTARITVAGGKITGGVIGDAITSTGSFALQPFGGCLPETMVGVAPRPASSPLRWQTFLPVLAGR